jgi:hypothetical protein
MQPMDGIVTGKGQWSLGSTTGDYLIYVENSNAPLNIQLSGRAESFRLHWIDRARGVDTIGQVITPNDPLTLRPNSTVLWLERIQPGEE